MRQFIIRPVLLHIIFWLGFTGYSLLIFSGLIPMSTNLLRTLTTMLMHAALVYANLYYLLPTFWDTERYTRWAGQLLAISLLIGAVRLPLDWLFLSDSIFFKESGWPGLLGGVFFSESVMLVISTAYHLSMKGLVQQKETQNKQLTAELKFLKAQISPHFLFNTLNNIYTLVELREESAGPMILKLSGLMRYIMQDSNQLTVPLTEEIEFIHHYLALYQLKYSHTDRLLLTINGDPHGIRLAPLLFAPLFENCFKYTDLDKPDGRITAGIRIGPDEITLTVSNVVNKPADQEQQNHGIGLHNLRQRLNLLYPNRHQLVTKHSDALFTATLTLQP